MPPAKPTAVACSTGCMTQRPELPAWCPKLWLTSKSTVMMVDSLSSSTGSSPVNLILKPLEQPGRDVQLAVRRHAGRGGSASLVAYTSPSFSTTYASQTTMRSSE